MGSYAELGDAVQPADEEQHSDLTPGEIRLRRLLAAGGAIAVVVGLLVFVPRLLRDEPPPRWDPPGWAAPVFPFEPSEPAGEPQIFVSGPQMTAQFSAGSRMISVTVAGQSPKWSIDFVEEHPADVGGRPATVRTAPNSVGVVWQLTDGRWLMVDGNTTEDGILEFARGLRPGSVSSPAPFDFTEVPPGLTLQQQSPWMMCLASPETAAEAVPPSGICAYLPRSPDRLQPLPDAEPVTVGGLSGRYQKNRDGGEMRVDLGDGRILDVYWDRTIRLGRDGVIRFAEATGLTG